MSFPPPPPSRSGLSAGWVALILVLATIVVLTFWSVVDPYADIPVISKIVCSAKGDTFTDGSPALGIPAGCYKVR